MKTIEHYVHQLDFHVSIEVRTANHTTSELAIVTARQEEAKLNRQNPNFTSLALKINRDRNTLNHKKKIIHVQLVITLSMTIQIL